MVILSDERGRCATVYQYLSQDKVGLIGALHGFGGQGKTALALQYAYAYAGRYASGGRWLLPCEGKASLLQVLEDLAPLVGYRLLEKADALAEEVRIALHLQQLRAYIDARIPEVEALRAASGELHRPDLQEPVAPRMLLILDNVDQPGLLSEATLAPFAAAKEWLEIIVHYPA